MVSPGALWNLCRAPVLTWCGLLILLAVTFALAYVRMSDFNLPVSLAIALVKALLVGAVFMRLNEDRPLHRLTALVGPIWIFIMFLLTGADYFTR
jgi:cytochrome c oxidase subunit IV